MQIRKFIVIKNNGLTLNIKKQNEFNSNTSEPSIIRKGGEKRGRRKYIPSTTNLYINIFRC